MHLRFKFFWFSTQITHCYLLESAPMISNHTEIAELFSIRNGTLLLAPAWLSAVALEHSESHPCENKLIS
jgi:hypothetical protein